MKTYKTKVDIRDMDRFKYFLNNIGMGDAEVHAVEVPKWHGHGYSIEFDIADDRESELLMFKLRRGYTVDEAFELWMVGRVTIDTKYTEDKEPSC